MYGFQETRGNVRKFLIVIESIGNEYLYVELLFAACKSLTIVMRPGEGRGRTGRAADGWAPRRR
jgi:hypothetical protein